MRDRAAAGDAPKVLHGEQASLEDLAAGVVEIDVDAFGKDLLELLAQAAGLVVDGRVEPEFVHQPTPLLGPARDADHPAPLDLGDLADDRAHRSSRRRHHDGFAGLGAATLEQAEVGGEARHAKDAEQMGHRLQRRQLGEALAWQDGVVLPARVGEHQVAGTQVADVGRHDLGQGAAGHHVAGV